MNLLENTLLYSFVAGLSTVAGVYIVKRFGEWTKHNALYLISFAVGVLFANAVFELIPQAQKLNAAWGYYVLAGIMLLFIIEHYMVLHACQEEECDIHELGYVGTIGIGFHSLIDGVVIGVGFAADFSLGVLASFAVIFHEIPEGMFTYSLLKYDNFPERKNLIYSWMVALATPVGAIVSYLALTSLPQTALGALLGIAAGTFVYIAAADLVPQAHRHPDFKHAGLIVAGIAFTIFMANILGA